MDAAEALGIDRALVLLQQPQQTLQNSLETAEVVQLCDEPFHQHFDLGTVVREVGKERRDLLQNVCRVHNSDVFVVQKLFLGVFGQNFGENLFSK